LKHQSFEPGFFLAAQRYVTPHNAANFWHLSVGISLKSLLGQTASI